MLRRLAPALCASLLAAHSLPAQQHDSPTFTVGTATAARGTTATGVIHVPAGVDSALDIPVAVIHGARPGPIVAFVAGSHGTEYSSIIAMQRLIPRIDARRLAGTVIVVPLVNIPSFERMVPHVNPVDGKGMNSSYPGDPAGTQTQRALAAITSDVLSPADVVVDLHGGDLDENLRPYAYWFRGGRPAQDSAGLRLVRAFGLDHVIVTDVDPNAAATARSLSGQALVRGKTVLVAEAGRSGVVTAEDLRELTEGSLAVLASLGMMEHAVHPAAHVTWLDGVGARIAADSAGVFVALVDRDAHVRKGEILGYTTDFLGRRTREIRSPIDGLVTFVRGVPSTWPKATLVNVLPILSTPKSWHPPAQR